MKFLLTLIFLSVLASCSSNVTSIKTQAGQVVVCTKDNQCEYRSLERRGDR